MAFGVLEHEYKAGIGVEQAKKIAVDAIRAAVSRDIASGGDGIDVATITQHRFKRLPVEDVEKLKK